MIRVFRRVRVYGLHYASSPLFYALLGNHDVLGHCAPTAGACAV